MKVLKCYLMMGAAALSLIVFNACSQGGDGGGDGSARGPGGTADFSGTTITVNPELTFLPGGVVQYFNDEVASSFPDADPAVSGTYTYVPNAGLTTGVLTLQLPAPVNTIVLNLSGFEVLAGNVTQFQATYNGTPFVANVTNGTLPSAAAPNNGGVNNEQPASDIPAGVQGAYNLTFEEDKIGSGIADASSEDFIIDADTLTVGGTVLNNPVFRNGISTFWIFKDGNLEYGVSENGGALNEINVSGPGGTPFYGQYPNP